MNLGQLYLIPTPIASEATQDIPENVQQFAVSLKHFFVENIRTARRVLKAFDKNVIIDEISFEEINQQHLPDLKQLKHWLLSGVDVGVMSEAGCPGTADPGNVLVALAHQLGAKVIPMVGPSSILLALMGSGFNGQQFRFVGYIPIKGPQRISYIKELESTAKKNNETQIFIETPYRNNQLMYDLLLYCHSETLLCIAMNMQSDNSFLKTKSLKEWKANLPDLHKQPTVFLLYST